MNANAARFSPRLDPTVRRIGGWVPNRLRGNVWMKRGSMAFWRRTRAVRRTRRLWPVGFVVVAGGLALPTGASATLAVRSSAASTSSSVVSAQYQAKNVSNAVEAGPRGSTAEPPRGVASHVAAEADPSKSRTWYHSFHLQYQLFRSIPERTTTGSIRYRLMIAGRTTPPTSRPISARKLIPTVVPGLNQKDARILFRLGLVLGLTYLVFLVVWLWGTRVRPHDRGRVVRY